MTTPFDASLTGAGTGELGGTAESRSGVDADQVPLGVNLHAEGTEVDEQLPSYSKQMSSPVAS